MGWNDFALIVATFLGPVGAVQTVGPPGRAGDARAAPNAIKLSPSYIISTCRFQYQFHIMEK